MEATDTLDKNKSRGFLIGYSSIILTLYYFDADLSTIKLLGNEIRLQNNINSIWMVLALINLYLLVRYMHRLPKNWWKFDEEMHQKCDEWIKFFCRIRHKKTASKLLTNLIKIRHDNIFNFDKAKISIQKIQIKLCFVPCTEQINGEQIERFHPDQRNRLLKNLSRFKLIQTTKINYHIEHETGTTKFDWDCDIPITPNEFTSSLITTLTILTGAIHKPWFFDVVGPILMAMTSIILSVIKWALINSYINP